MQRIASNKPLVKFCEGLYLKQGIAVTIIAEEIIPPHHTGFQELALYRNDQLGHILALDGNIQWFERGERYYTEPTSYFPVFAKSGVTKNVLVIGGGDLLNAGALCAINTIERIDVVDIDKRVREVTLEYAPQLTNGAASDPRVRTFDMDAAAFVETLERFELYDVVIIDSTDETDAAKPIFTECFLRRVWKMMHPGGVLVRVAGSELLQKSEVAGVLDAVANIFGKANTGALFLPVPMYYAAPFVVAVGFKDREFTNVPSCSEFLMSSAGLLPSRYYGEYIHRAIAHSYSEIRSAFD